MLNDKKNKDNLHSYSNLSIILIGFFIFLKKEIKKYGNIKKYLD